MKSNILTHTIAALLVAAPIAQADDKKPDEKRDSGKSSSASTSVVTSSDGTATVTIDINGKKETRTFKLGDGNNTFSFSTDGDGAKAGGVVGVGGRAGLFQPPGKRERGPWIGIAMEPVQDVVRAQLSLAPGEGIVVSYVVPDSPAARAGLETNDILLRFDDQIIVEPSQLRKLIAMKKPGESVKLTYMRKGERKETSATLVEHDLEPEGKGPMEFLQGIPRFQGGNDAMRRMEEQFKQLKEKHPGVVVDKRSWFSGSAAGGDELIRELETERDLLDMLVRERDMTDSLKGLPKDEAEKKLKWQRQAEEALESRRKRIDEQLKALKAAKRARPEGGTKSDESAKPAGKKPGESL